MMRRLLILLIVIEILIGGYLAARRLLRPAPPLAETTLLDLADAADEIRAAAAVCESAEDWRNLGELYMAAGCFAEAEMCHRVACDLDPDNALFARQWAFALERLALLDEANKQYARAAELSSAEADASHYFIARNLLRAEKPEEARAEFTTGKTLPVSRYELARLRLRAGDIKEAAALLDDLAAAHPDLLQVNLLRYRLEKERGNDREAFIAADRARYAAKKLQGPFDVEAERMVNVTRGLASGRLWKDAMDLINANRLKAAEQMLETAGRDRSAGLELRAEIAIRQKRFDAAIGLFEEIQDRLGVSARILSRIGDVWDAAGRPTQARASWLRATQVGAGADLKAIHHKLADSFASAKDQPASDHHRARGHYYVGRDLLQFGFAPKAVDYFAAAVKLDPTFAQAWFYLGEANRLGDQPAAAREAYRSCLERAPHHGRARANLAFTEDTR